MHLELSRWWRHWSRCKVPMICDFKPLLKHSLEISISDALVVLTSKRDINTLLILAIDHSNFLVIFKDVERCLVQCKHFSEAMKFTIITQRLVVYSNYDSKKISFLPKYFTNWVCILHMKLQFSVDDERTSHGRIICMASRLRILVSKWMLTPWNGNSLDSIRQVSYTFYPFL